MILLYQFLASLIIAVALSVGWEWHGERVGAAKIQAQDEAAAAKQRAIWALKESDYAKQIAAADVARTDYLSRLHGLAAVPAPHILCHAAGGSAPVPSVPSEAHSAPVGPGVASGMPGPDFDPAPALRRLSLAYAGRCADYVDAVNRWPE